MFDSLGHTQHSCVEVLKQWILLKRELVQKFKEIDIIYVSDKVST